MLPTPDLELLASRPVENTSLLVKSLRARHHETLHLHPLIYFRKDTVK